MKITKNYFWPDEKTVSCFVERCENYRFVILNIQDCTESYPHHELEKSIEKLAKKVSRHEFNLSKIMLSNDEWKER